MMAQEKKPFVVTVSQLNRRIALMFRGEKAFDDLCVKGEVSNFSPNERTGHIFFTLKDGASSVKAVIFSSVAQRLNFLPENGMSVVVRGNVKCFERDGIYNLYVSERHSGGEGALSAEFERLKKKLEDEGIFSRKRELPYPPKKICIITSPTGAALQDMLNILSRRYPLVKVLLIPTAVQGEYAPESICAAFRTAGQTDADLIIFGRGGGSSEDLSAFNSEAVVRAVFDSGIPTISAVGHETDFTLADFAADKRVATPSAAAEIAVPDIGELFSTLVSAKEYIGRKALDTIRRRELELDALNMNIRTGAETDGGILGDREPCEADTSVKGTGVSEIRRRDRGAQPHSGAYEGLCDSVQRRKNTAQQKRGVTRRHNTGKTLRGQCERGRGKHGRRITADRTLPKGGKR